MRHDRAFWIGLVVMLLSLVSGLATYLILTNLTPIVPTSDVVLVVLFVNVILILSMIAVIGWHMLGLWRAWREKVAGSRLHIRIVGLFSVIAALPALLLAIAATTSFARGLDQWFSSRPRQIIQTSVAVADAYLEEHGQTIRTDLLNMARDLDTAQLPVRTNPARLRELLVGQAGLRELAVADIIDAHGDIAIAGMQDDEIHFERPSESDIKEALEGRVQIYVSNKTKRVSGIARLASYPGYFLYVARGVNPNVIDFLRETRARLAEYEQIRKSRVPLTVLHGLMYFMTALTALLSAIWAGFWFARRFVDPIGRLIGAAQQVSRGNLNVHLPVIRGEGDLRRLSQNFNTMTHELATQRNDLVAANTQLTERRQFMEAVLSGVSAGVLGVDRDGCIVIANSSAQRLLGIGDGELIGRPLGEAVPEFVGLLAIDRDEQPAHGQTETKLSINGEERTFSVRVTRQGQPREAPGAHPNPETTVDRGSVITFDDITELVSAQRTSAWGEVARRMAHEIKNPLTPIILSAERIRRKYGRVITEDKDTFEKLTATIERQAGDIKTMVDEFAAFARIPKPVMEIHDLRESIQEPMILFRESHPGLTYNCDLPPAPVMASFDRRLISQALTNLVKNATEAVEMGPGATEPGWKGRIEARLRVLANRYEIEVVDNGPGLPKQNRKKLLEPYVTTKGSKGTGLGLAIVQKIVEQHGGVLTLEDAPAVTPAAVTPAGATAATAGADAGTPPVPSPASAEDASAEPRAHGAMVRLTLPIRRLEPAAETLAPAAAE